MTSPVFSFPDIIPHLTESFFEDSRGVNLKAALSRPYTKATIGTMLPATFFSSNVADDY
jgi:hypothetical protein